MNNSSKELLFRMIVNKFKKERNQIKNEYMNINHTCILCGKALNLL